MSIINAITILSWPLVGREADIYVPVIDARGARPTLEIMSNPTQTQP